MISALTGCKEQIPMLNLGIDDTYYIFRMQKLLLQPALTGREYRWSMDGREVSTSRDYIFLPSEEGTYNLKIEIIDEFTPYEFDFTVNVLHEEIEYSPYIARVYEYCPAPGQFINTMPQYEDGDTYADILQKAEESISGKNDIMVSLGGYGGYITFGFDHTVINRQGKDFRIWGNSFYELTDADKKGGSAEPGIVMISYDVNCNGKPDDQWYELIGSEYYNPATKFNYTITYRRPDPNHVPIEDPGNSLTDVEYIPWTDSDGQSGFIAKNMFHDQDYFPQWVDGDELTFTGSRLPDNAIDKSGNGTYYILYCYDWGYVDNHPNDVVDANTFDISNAVDERGMPVDLPGIDFIRVYTGVNQYCGWLGETSTELCRAQDLNIEELSDLPPDPIP